MNQWNYSSWALGNLKRQETNTKEGSPKPEMTKVHPAFYLTLSTNFLVFNTPLHPPF
jgi:hypothetical protein